MGYNKDALARARLSLEGLSVGDALGGFYEFGTAERLSHVVEQRQVPNVTWHYTDDTNMALSIYETLRLNSGINQDALASSFVEHYERLRGYGRGVRSWVARCTDGEDWRHVSNTLFKGTSGSFGNGSAMRVAPIGAYFADDLEAAAHHAALSAEITHSHPEGIAGAIAIAVGAAVAWQSRQEMTTRSQFLSRIIPFIPEGAVREGTQKAYDMPPHLNITMLASFNLGNGHDAMCRDTVPLALWLSGTYLYEYEEAIWQTISAGGDVDTLAAMVGGIVALSSGESTIPQEWREHREELPEWALGSP
jgi:ADP-ribosylglycohydrolase